jgi:hypothetical protein
MPRRAFENRVLLRLLRVAILAALLSFGASTLAATQSEHASFPKGTVGGELTCAVENVMTIDQVVDVDPKALPGTPEEAVEEGAPQFFPEIAPSAYAEDEEAAANGSDSSGSVDDPAIFAHDENGETVAAVAVSPVGDGWVATAASVCLDSSVDVA